MMVVLKAREDASEQVDALKFMACAKIFVMAVYSAKDSQSTVALQRRGPEPRSVQMGSHPRGS